MVAKSKFAANGCDINSLNELGTKTRAGHYQLRHPLGDETIPGFLGGRKPEDSPELYRRISPVYQVDKIKTPLLLVIGEKDTRYNDTMEFYAALRKVGSPVSLLVYPGEGHGISTPALADQHVQRALEFFRSTLTSTR